MYVYPNFVTTHHEAVAEYIVNKLKSQMYSYLRANSSKEKKRKKSSLTF